MNRGLISCCSNPAAAFIVRTRAHSESERMVAAQRKNKVPVWYIVGKNERYGFARKANQESLQSVEVEFLRHDLLGMSP